MFNTFTKFDILTVFFILLYTDWSEIRIDDWLWLFFLDVSTIEIKKHASLVSHCLYIFVWKKDIELLVSLNFISWGLDGNILCKVPLEQYLLWKVLYKLNWKGFSSGSYIQLLCWWREDTASQVFSFYNSSLYKLII